MCSSVVWKPDRLVDESGHPPDSTFYWSYHAQVSWCVGVFADHHCLPVCFEQIREEVHLCFYKCSSSFSFALFHSVLVQENYCIIEKLPLLFKLATPFSVELDVCKQKYCHGLFCR